MSGVTDILGLILPADGEAYDVEILNQNFKALDAAIKRLPYKEAVGKTTISMGAGVANETVTVALPAGFTVAPIVTPTLASNVAGRASLLKVSSYQETTGNFILKIQTSDNANIGTSYNIVVNWVATQKTATSAAG